MLKKHGIKNFEKLILFSLILCRTLIFVTKVYSNSNKTKFNIHIDLA